MPEYAAQERLDSREPALPLRVIVNSWQKNPLLYSHGKITLLHKCFCEQILLEIKKETKAESFQSEMV